MVKSSAPHERPFIAIVHDDDRARHGEARQAAINAGSGRNAATLDKFPKSILTGTFDFGGPMGLMLKDLSLFIEQSQAYGVPGLMAPAALAAWEEAVRRTGFDADYTKLIQHMEADAGVTVRAQ